MATYCAYLAGLILILRTAHGLNVTTLSVPLPSPLPNDSNTMNESRGMNLTGNSSGSQCSDGSRAWRIVASATDSGWAWDVLHLNFMSDWGDVTEGNQCSVFDSGAASDAKHGNYPKYEPEHALNGSRRWWGGRKHRGQFYIGIKCTDPAVVQLVSITQRSRHFASCIQLQHLYQNEWTAVNTVRLHNIKSSDGFHVMETLRVNCTPGSTTEKAMAELQACSAKAKNNATVPQKKHRTPQNSSEGFPSTQQWENAPSNGSYFKTKLANISGWINNSNVSSDASEAQSIGGKLNAITFVLFSAGAFCSIAAVAVAVVMWCRKRRSKDPETRDAPVVGVVLGNGESVELEAPEPQKEGKNIAKQLDDNDSVSTCASTQAPSTKTQSKDFLTVDVI